MKANAKRFIRDERGKVLILALLLLGVGGLLMAPTLGLMTTGLSAGQVYEKKTDELYAADAGVEDAIWKLQHELELPTRCSASGWKYPDEDDPPYEFELNGTNVQVSIEYLKDHDDSAGIFKITSIARDESGGTTTVLSYVQANYEEGGILSDYDAYDGETMSGISYITVYGEGDLIVTGNIQDSATVYVEGDLDVGGNIENGAHVFVKGNLELTGFGNIENTAIVCVGGNLTVGHCSEDAVEIYVEENLIADGIESLSKICVEGNIAVGGIEDDPYVCAGLDLTATLKIEGGDLRVGGTITAPTGEKNPSSTGPFSDCDLCSPACPDCRICCECPLVFEGTGQGSWTNWAVTTYLINPESD